MPGLRLTVRQAARLFSVAPDVADAVLHELRRASILARSSDGAFSLNAGAVSGADGSEAARGRLMVRSRYGRSMDR